MIRATRGRSRRPNHMHSHLDALQAMPPVNLRRVARDSHSVAKQASFYIALGTDFQGFWRPKWLPNSVLEAFFPTLFFNVFEHPMLVDFSRLRIRKIAIFPKVLCVLSQNCFFVSRCLGVWAPK